MGGTRFLRGLRLDVAIHAAPSRQIRRVKCLHLLSARITTHHRPSDPSPCSRALHNITHLLDLIAQFPRVNPSASEPSELDIPRLFRQIRSRYKVLCATLGTKPSVRAGGSGVQDDAPDSGDAPPDTQASRKKSPVWGIDNSARQPSRSEALSF